MSDMSDGADESDELDRFVLAGLLTGHNTKESGHNNLLCGESRGMHDGEGFNHHLFGRHVEHETALGNGLDRAVAAG